MRAFRRIEVGESAARAKAAAPEFPSLSDSFFPLSSYLLHASVRLASPLVPHPAPAEATFRKFIRASRHLPRRSIPCSQGTRARRNTVPMPPGPQVPAAAGDSAGYVRASAAGRVSATARAAPCPSAIATATALVAGADRRAAPGRTRPKRMWAREKWCRRGFAPNRTC